MPMNEKTLYEFGSFRLDAGQRVLLRDGELVPLAPKAFDTLLELVESEGQVLDKEELLKRIWPDTFVEEGSLAQNISVLRKTLGDGTDGLQYIQTIPKRGYRFVAPVRLAETVTRSAPPADPVVSNRPSRKYVLAAAAVAVLAATAILVWQRWQAKPLTDQDVLVLADFTNSTGDPVFDSTLRDALAFQLEQSPFLKVLDDVVMRQDLQLMRRSPQEHITNDLAHDICVREADKAMLGGSIASLGKAYAIELKATNCLTGATLARQQAEAADKDHVLQALATAAKGIRAKLGESLSSIQKLAPPPDPYRVTTSSLEAFQAFHAGAELYTQGRLSEAVPFLQHATQSDPNLAFAWAWLGVAYYNSGGDRKRYLEYGDRAWELRDRVSAYERLWITSSRDGQTIGEYINNYETWARTFPRDAMPIIELGRIHASAGEFEEALAKFQQAYRLQSRRAIHVIDLMMMYGRLDRFDDAKAVAGKMFAQGEDAPMLHRQLLAVAYAQADQESAAKEIGWFTGKPEEYLSLADQGREAKLLGQMRKSKELLQRAADLARLRNLPDAAAGFLKPDASWDALLGNCETARRTNVVSDTVLALCGSAALAERAEELNKHWTSGVLKNPAQVPLTRAAEEFGLGHPQKAIELLQAVAPYERAYPFANYLRGLAYLRVHKGTEAAAEFQKILDHRGANWGTIYPLSYVGLARGAALAGDASRARQAYQDFLALWKDADPDVPVLIQARKEYAGLAQ
jgi:DNA-binding winged helix-turn-helix (wHTH) protein/tetratricopeptide (TPR) repeat protein